MTAQAPKLSQSIANVVGETPDYRFYFLSELLKCPVVSAPDARPVGKLKDLVVKIASPYPKVVGLLVDHGWGKPHEFFPWDRVASVAPGLLTLAPHPEDVPYRPYEDQPGWLLLNEHLMGQTILDIDGRRTKDVNDLHLLESKGRMLLVHVDTSARHPLHRLGFGRGAPSKDSLISWRIFRPLSIDDASSDTVMLSVTRKAAKYLPGEDLAAALEEIKRQESAPSAPATGAALPLSSDFVTTQPGTRVADLLASLRGSNHSADSVASIFVTAADGSLLGVADLCALALAAGDSTLQAHAQAPTLTLKTDATSADASAAFRSSILRCIPVVDEQGRIKGVVRRPDLSR